WLERSSLWAWYCVHKLAAAKAGELQIWAERIAALDIAAVPKLLGYLSRTDAAACGNTEAGLLEIVRQWEPGDPRRADLAHSLAAGFATFSVPGQQAALTIQANLLQGTAANPPGLDLLRATTRMLVEASSVSDTEVRSKALVLAAGLIGSSSG